MDQEKMGKFFGILAACVGMAILIFSRNQEVRVLQYYINYFTLLVFGLLCVAGVLLSGKKTKMEILFICQIKFQLAIEVTLANSFLEVNSTNTFLCYCYYAVSR